MKIVEENDLMLTAKFIVGSATDPGILLLLDLNTRILRSDNELNSEPP